MGRKKIQILKKPEKQQLTAYNKRKDGISKKATELAILCDIDVLLLTVSPKGRQDLTLGPNSNFENIIRRYGRVDPQQREKRRHECVKNLCKAYKTDTYKHQVDTKELLNYGAPKVADTYKISAEEMQLIDSKLGKLKHVAELFVIDDMGLLTDMETELLKLLEQTNELIMKNQQMLVPRESNFQTFPVQEEINNPALSNINNDLSMPSSYVHQTSRNSTNPSVASSSMPPLVMNEDPVQKYLNCDSDLDVMNCPQKGSWWQDTY